MYSDYGKDYIPRRMTEHSAGYDFFSPIDRHIEPLTVEDIDTGVHLEDGDIGLHQSMELSARSSFRKKYGMQIVGLIDSDYRGSIHALIISLKPVDISKGERFMQGVVRNDGRIANEIPPTVKRTGGTGSTDMINYS